MDDMVFPSFSSAKAKTKSTQFGESESSRDDTRKQD